MNAPVGTSEDLLYSVADGIARLTFNRPQARNALTFAMYEQMATICANINQDHSIKALILTGAGDKAFASGTDISQFRAFKTAQDALDYEARIDRVLGMRHQADHVARGVAHARDAAGRPVGVRVGVPEHDLPGCLQVGQRARVGGVTALATLQRHDDLLVGVVGPCPRRPRVLHPQPQVPGDEAKADVAGQRPR